MYLKMHCFLCVIYLFVLLVDRASRSERATAYVPFWGVLVILAGFLFRLSRYLCLGCSDPCFRPPSHVYCACRSIHDQSADAFWVVSGAQIRSKVSIGPLTADPRRRLLKRATRSTRTVMSLIAPNVLCSSLLYRDDSKRVLCFEPSCHDVPCPEHLYFLVIPICGAVVSPSGLLRLPIALPHLCTLSVFFL